MYLNLLCNKYSDSHNFRGCHTALCDGCEPREAAHDRRQQRTPPWTYTFGGGASIIDALDGDALSIKQLSGHGYFIDRLSYADLSLINEGRCVQTLDHRVCVHCARAICTPPHFELSSSCNSGVCTRELTRPIPLYRCVVVQCEFLCVCVFVRVRVWDCAVCTTSPLSVT